MKVLIVSKYFYPVVGGVETNAFYVAGGLAKKKVDVAVLASGEEYSEEKIKGIWVTRVPTWLTIGPTPISPGIFFEIMNRDFDIANLHEPNPFQNFLAYLALKIRGKPYVITYHSDIVPHSLSIRLIKFFYVDIFQRYFLFRGAKRIMPTSPMYIDLSDILPHFRTKCDIVPNGVDLSVFKPRKGKQGKKILFVGRLIYYKGVQYLIRAMPDILKKVPKAELVLVGDGPLKSEWKELAKELKVDRRIRWISRASDKEVLKQYQNADVFVLPSIYKSEAFGIVLLEAMACGVPCVGTNISGTEYVLQDAGIIIEPEDEKKIAESVIKVFTDEKLARKMGNDGLKKVRNFEWKKITEKVLSVYKGVLR